MLIVGITIILISISKEVTDKQKSDNKDSIYNSKLRDLKAQNEDLKNQVAKARDSIINFAEVKKKQDSLKPKTLSKKEISAILTKVYAQQRLMGGTNQVMLCYGQQGLSYPAVMSQLRAALKQKNFEVMGTDCTVNMGEKFSLGIYVKGYDTFNTIQIVVGELP